jgi:GDP-mannose 4,6-dehydratase
MSKYLITGVTGFAGPHLVNLLYSEGHEIHGIIRNSNGREQDIRDVVSDDAFSKIKFHYADLSNKKIIDEVLKENQYDGVFHLAAQSHPPTSFIDPLGTFKENIINSTNLITAVTEYQDNCKLMFCSTSEVYGNQGSEGNKIHWNSQLTPSNPYGVSKASIDIFMQERMENNYIIGYITRAFSHTGPRRGMNFSISSDAYQLARIKKGLQGNILNIGNLETTRVVIDVRDTVNAYYQLMLNEDSNRKIFNVCGDVPRKMEFFTDKLIEISGLKVEKKISKELYRPIDIMYQHGNSDNLVELTDWKPKIEIEDTLSDLFQYWMNKIQ